MIWTFAIAVLMSSCRHHDLCYHHSHEVKIRVVYDWQYCPDAAPSGMCAYFYSEETGAAIRIDFDDRAGGWVSLPTGRYRIISYNNDCLLTQFDNNQDFEAHMAYTRQGNLLEPLYTDVTTPSQLDGEHVVICPDEIYQAKAVDVDIRQDGISYVCVSIGDNGETDYIPVTSEEQVIYLFPTDILCHYSYEVRNVKGLERIAQVCGSISGMCPSVKISSLDKHTLPVTLPFGAAISDDGRIVGEFLTFGHHDDVANPHNMEFYVWTKAGTSYILGRGADNHNVTAQVHQALNPRRVHLIIDHMEVPEDNGSPPPAAATSADDWFEIDTPIDL